MTALSSPVRIPTIPRRQRAAVTVALGLSAGAVGWSELASAEGQQLQTLILPDHYQRLITAVLWFPAGQVSSLS